MLNVAGDGAAGTLRRAMALLVAVSVLSVAVALAYERHWGEFWQLVPWAALVVTGLALAALVLRASRATVRIARAVAVLVLLTALIGAWRHFDHNYSSAAIDQEYADRWEEMSDMARWWAVANGSVGHTPVPAAGALVPVGLTLWMTTLGLGEQSRRTAGARRREP